MRVCVCPRRGRLTQPNTRGDMAYAGLEIPSVLSLSLWGLQASREPDGKYRVRLIGAPGPALVHTPRYC